ncbi:phage polarity suppression protein, partial [Escherichia coli]
AALVLRRALVGQLEINPPEIAGDYREILVEAGLMPDPGMIRDCQGSYTPAQHLRFHQRLNDINDIQE